MDRDVSGVRNNVGKQEETKATGSYMFNLAQTFVMNSKWSMTSTTRVFVVQKGSKLRLTSVFFCSAFHDFQIRLQIVSLLTSRVVERRKTSLCVYALTLHSLSHVLNLFSLFSIISFHLYLQKESFLIIQFKYCTFIIS